MSINVGIVGSTGYAGAELVRLLSLHPNANISAISSVSYEGKKISEIYPNLAGICDMVCVNQETVIKNSEVIFACLPHGLSQDLAKQCYNNNIILIDLGADFRLYSEDDYFEWYSGKYDDQQLHKQSVYGLPEIYRDRIKSAKIVANPGCYPTSAALALYPALKENIISTENIIIDSKSGVTGAGRGLSQTTHFPDCNEAFSPYKIASHRHTPEIEQTLSEASGKKITVVFTPHLLPVNRGILSTIYSKVINEISFEQIIETYRAYYSNEPFVRVAPDGATVNLKNVKYSNYCDLSLHYDKRTNTLIIISAIDNMVKGASGQAIQNFNIIFGFPENTGLTMPPPAF